MTSPEQNENSSPRASSTFLRPETLEEIQRLGQAVLPNEACGVIYNHRVIQVPNRADDPAKSYVLHGIDIVEALRPYDEAEATDLIIWHTHPSGRIGPGPGDMGMRLEGFRYLVVSLPGGEATFF